MTTRTFTDKNKNEWSWEETPETIEALKQLHETVEKQKERAEQLKSEVKSKFAGNYPGPLYAPHPNLENEQQTTDA